MPTPYTDEKLLAKLSRLLRRPRTVDDLANSLDVTERSVYRYLKLLEDRGVPVRREGVGRPVRYLVPL